MVRKSVSAVDMVNIPFCCEGYFYIPGWPLEPQGWLPPIEWNIFAKRLGSSHKTEVQMAWHLHWGFFLQLFNLMFLSVQSFQQLCPFIQNLNVASKGIALPKLSNSLFLCWETIWNFVHIADVKRRRRCWKRLARGSISRQWLWAPWRKKNSWGWMKKEGYNMMTCPVFFSSPRCYIQFK